MALPSFITGNVVLQLMLGYIFMASGFIVSFLMCIGMVIWPFSKTWYRKYCHMLSYALWSQFSNLAHFWCDAHCDLYIDPEDQKYLGHEHCVCIVNHTFQIDWLMAWMMAERHGMLGNTKIYGKEILKYIPVLGWTWYFTESIFLKRNWEEDKKILTKSINDITTYPDNFWVTLLLFPEGTRWTPEKHAVCQKVAKEKGYPEYKHMLLPRTKGFALSVQLMKGKIPAVIDVTVGFPGDEPEPTLLDAIAGKKIRCALKVKRYLVEDIPAETEEACGKWLRDLFKQKDDDLKFYLQTGKFEGLPLVEVPQRKYDLCCFIFWAILTCIPLFYYLHYVIFASSLSHQVIFVAVFVALILLMKWMIRFSDVKHGTSYGLQHPKKTE